MQYSMEKGPLMVRLARSGHLKLLPKIHCSVAYKFFAGSPVFFVSEVVSFEDDCSIQVVRHNQWVFAHDMFTHAAWREKDDSLGSCKLDVEKEQDMEVEILSSDIPWILFYNEKDHDALGTITVEYASFRRDGQEPITTRSRSEIVIHGKRDVRYWLRHPIYGWTPNYLGVPAGGGNSACRRTEGVFNPALCVARAGEL